MALSEKYLTLCVQIKRLHVFSYLNSRVVLLKHFLKHKQTSTYRYMKLLKGVI